MHTYVQDRVSKARQRSIERYNGQTNIISPIFQEVEFVLVRRAQDKVHNLCFKGLGPKRMTKIVNNMVYEVSSIMDGTVEKVHAARLILYRPDLENSEVSDILRRHAKHSEAK